MIRFATHHTRLVENPESKKLEWELSHWFINDEHGNTAACVRVGFYATRQEAEDAHINILTIALLDENVKKMFDKEE